MEGVYFSKFWEAYATQAELHPGVSSGIEEKFS